MKKLNKLFAILVSLAMMATLCVSMAFAREDPAIEVYFTKTWSTNTDVATPATTFTFEIDQDTENGVANDAEINDQTIPYSANETGTKTSTDLLAGQDFKNASGKVVPGVYIYTIKETVPATAVNNVVTETSTSGTATTTTKTTYSDKEYTLKVYVNKDGEVEAAYVYDGETKVNSDEPTSGSENGFNFKNTYSKSVTNTPTGTTEDGNGDSDGLSAYVEKEITAADDGMIDTDQEFSFSTTVTFPDIDAADSYTAYVIDASGNKVGNDIVFTESNATQTYTLKHGYRLFFANIDLGATYTATEDLTGVDGYTKSGEQATGLNVTAAANGVTVINNYTKSSVIPDSGVIISNLPYIVLALVAIGGMVAYVVIRRKSSDEA